MLAGASTATLHHLSRVCKDSSECEMFSLSIACGSYVVSLSYRSSKLLTFLSNRLDPILLDLLPCWPFIVFDEMVRSIRFLPFRMWSLVSSLVRLSLSAFSC